MGKENNKILITTPIFYPNDEPHIGSIHTLIMSDFLKRSFQILEYDVFLSVGVDENCEKINKKAKSLNLETKHFVDSMATNFKKAMETFKISFDRFIRTTDDDHKNTVKHFWNQMEHNNLIYKNTYAGYYSVSDETFFKESDLVNGKAPTGADVYWEEIPAYFYKSSELLEELDRYFEEHPNLTTPKNRLNELKGFIQNGLYDLCISRKNENWGILVPNDDNFVVYVWFDALTNYLTVCGYPNVNEYWNGRVIHIVGKDIAIFHGVHWPSMILGHKNIKMFDDLLVHNWWMVDNSKMSKSKGNVIKPLEIMSSYSLEALRFYCLKENLLKSDGDFDIEKMISYFNTFAVGKFSNLVYRLWTILHRNNIRETELLSNELFESRLSKNIEKLEITEYIDTLFEWCDSLNQEIDKNHAWKDVDLSRKLFKETLSLVKYFEPIFPGLLDIIYNNITPVIFFKNMTI